MPQGMTSDPFVDTRTPWSACNSLAKGARMNMPATPSARFANSSTLINLELSLVNSVWNFRRAH